MSFAGIGGAFIVKKREYDFVDDENDSVSQPTSHSEDEEEDSVVDITETHELDHNFSPSQSNTHFLNNRSSSGKSIRDNQETTVHTPSPPSPSLSTTSSLSLSPSPLPPYTVPIEEASLNQSNLSRKSSVRFSMDYEEDTATNQGPSLLVSSMLTSLSDDGEDRTINDRNQYGNNTQKKNMSFVNSNNFNDSNRQSSSSSSSVKVPVSTNSTNSSPIKSPFMTLKSTEEPPVVAASSSSVFSPSVSNEKILSLMHPSQKPALFQEEPRNSPTTVFRQPLQQQSHQQFSETLKAYPETNSNYSPAPPPLVRKKSNFAPILGGGMNTPSMDSFGGYIPNLPNHGSTIYNNVNVTVPGVSPISVANPSSSSASSPAIIHDLDQGCRVVLTIPGIHEDGWEGGIAGIAISRFREFIVTAGRYDGKVRLWNTGTGQEFDCYEVENEIIMAAAPGDEATDGYSHINNNNNGGSRTSYLNGNQKSTHGPVVDYVGISKSYDEFDKPAIFMRDKKSPPTQINCMALAPNDSFVLVGCNNSLIYGWDLITKQRILIDGRKGFASRNRRSIQVLCIANNMDYFVHGDEQGVISTWRMTNQCKLKIDPDDKDNYLVLGMRFNNYSLTPDLTSSISISTQQSCIYAIVNNRVAAWEYSTGKDFFMEDNHLEKADDCILSGDGQVFVTRYYEDGTSIVRLFNTVNWEKIITIQCHGSRVCSFSITWDGALLVTGHDDGRVILWDAMIGEQLLQHNLQENRIYNPLKVLSNIFVSISPDGSMICAGHCKSGILKVWNTTFEEHHREIKIRKSHENRLQWDFQHRCVRRLNDEVIVATDDKEETSPNDDYGNNLALFRIDCDSFNSNYPCRIQGLHKFQVHDLKACSSDGHVLIVTDSNQNLMIWETSTNELVLLEEDFHAFNVGNAMASKVIMSGNGKYVFAYLVYDHGNPMNGGNSDHFLHHEENDDDHSVISNLSDISIGEKKFFAKVFKWTIFDGSMNGSRQSSGLQGQDCVKLYDKIIPHFDGGVNSFLVNLNDLPFQSTYDGHKLVFWSSEFYGSFQILDTIIGEVSQVIRTGWTFSESVAMRFSSDGKHILFGNGTSNSLTVYNITTGSVVHEVKHKQFKEKTILRSSEIAEDNSIFITVSDLMFTIWDMKTGSHLHDITIPSEAGMKRTSKQSTKGQRHGSEIHKHIGSSTSTASSPRIALMLQEMRGLGIDVQESKEVHNDAIKVPKPNRILNIYSTDTYDEEDYEPKMNETSDQQQPVENGVANEDLLTDGSTNRITSAVPIYIEKVTISHDSSYFIMTLTNQQRYRFENLYRNINYRQINPKVTSLTSMYKVFQYELDLVNNLPSYPWTIMKRMLSNPIEEKLIHWFLLQSRTVNHIVTNNLEDKSHASDAHLKERHDIDVENIVTNKTEVYCDHIMHYAIMKPSAYGFIKLLIDLYPQIIFLKRYGIYSRREYQRFIQNDIIDSNKDNNKNKNNNHHLFTILIPALLSKETRTINLVLDAILSTLELSAQLNNLDKGNDEGSIIHYGRKQDLIVHRHSHLSEKISIMEIANVANTSPDMFLNFIKRLQLFVNEGTTTSSRHPIGYSQSSAFYGLTNDDGSSSDQAMSLLVIGGSKRRTPSNYWYNFFQLRKENGSKLPWYTFQRLYHIVNYLIIDWYFPTKFIPVTPYVLPIKDMTMSGCMITRAHDKINQRNSSIISEHKAAPFLLTLRNTVLEVDDYSVLTNEVVTSIIIYKWQRFVQSHLYFESCFMIVFVCTMFFNAFYFEEFVPFHASSSIGGAAPLSSPDMVSSDYKVFQSLGILSIVFSMILCIRKIIQDIKRCNYYSRQSLLLYHLVNGWTINHFLVNIFSIAIIVLQIIVLFLYELPGTTNIASILMETLHDDMRCVAAITMPLLAFEFLSIIKGFPDIGYSIGMLLQVIINLKTLFFLLLLSIVAFAGSFSLLLKSTVGGPDSWGYSTSYWHMLLTVFNMVFGVYSIDDLHITNNSANGDSINHGLTAFMLVGFLFLVVVILLSFFISSMTHRMKALTNQVVTANSLGLINLILECEENIPESKKQKEDPWIQVLKKTDHISKESSISVLTSRTNLNDSNKKYK